MDGQRVLSRHLDYDVVVRRGAWRALRQFPLGSYTSVFVLTERGLWRRWGKRFLRESGLNAARGIFVPPGETSKSLESVGRTASQLLEAGADRRSLLVLFGGGVIGDLGGFVASTFMRGIDYVQAPTTVVAQVDSAIGGKTGVNVGAMKNLVGTFCPPRLVLAEPAVLGSLDARAFRSGLYEVVKHAILAGASFFHRLERNLPALRQSDPEGLTPVLRRAAEVKVGVVSRDEREAGWRRVLNLGHTFGHALEEATRYRRFLHGEAVGWGLLAVIELAKRLGWLRSTSSGYSDADRMIGLVRQVGPLPPIHDLSVAEILRLLPRDKKTVGGRIHWIIPARIGKVRIVSDVPLTLAGDAFMEVQRASRGVGALP